MTHHFLGVHPANLLTTLREPSSARSGKVEIESTACFEAISEDNRRIGRDGASSRVCRRLCFVPLSQRQ